MMKKAALLCILAVLLLLCAGAGAEGENGSSFTPFDAPEYTALGLDVPDSGTVQAAAALLRDWLDFSGYSEETPVGVSAFTYEFQEETTAYFCYYLEQKMLFIAVNFPECRGGASCMGPVDASTSEWNENTARQIHSYYEQNLQDNGTRVLTARFFTGTELSLSVMQSRAAEAAEEEFPCGTWYNIKGSDTYTLQSGGLGYHDGIPVTYTYSGNTVSVLENVMDLYPSVFTVDSSAGFTRLIPEDESTYYVEESDYARLSAVAREQTTGVLTSAGTWSAVDANNSLQFSEDGTGRFMVLSETYDLTWEFVDNDTIRMNMDTGSGSYTLTVTVVNTSGKYTLNDDAGTIRYIQKQ